MKRVFYIIAFMVLGWLLQFLLHALVENWYIKLLLSDFERYSLGWSWEGWFMIHDVATVVLLLAGLSFGWWQGRYWWPRLYDEAGRRHQRQAVLPGPKLSCLM